MMPYFNPLLIVATTLVLLWVLGRLLSLANTQSESIKTKKVRGTEVLPNLHVVGLTDESITEFKTLMDAQDTKNLAEFLALKKPALVELDEFIEQLRTQYLRVLGKPVGQATEIEKIAATSQLNIAHTPAGFNFVQLNKNELRELMVHDANKRRLINHEFISKFGESDFMDNFQCYTETVQDLPITLLVAEGDKYRKSMEVFVQTGIALQGRKIPLQDRLGVLKLSQLREMAAELKLDQDFDRRADATKGLAEVPGSAILLAMLVNIDDIFMVKPQNIDIAAVENEWSVISTYAKLLCNRI